MRWLGALSCAIRSATIGSTSSNQDNHGHFVELCWLFFLVISLLLFFAHASGTETYLVQCWSLEVPQDPSSTPQPQYWITLLDPWMQDFYPVLGWVWHPHRENPTRPFTRTHPHWIKIGFPTPPHLNEC